MDETIEYRPPEKPFGPASVVILILLALANDAAEAFFDFLAATIIGLPGEVIMKPVDLVFDAIFTVWFFFKLGFGGPSLLNVAGDVFETVGFPTRTIIVGIAIWMANKPALASTVELIGAAESFGASSVGEAGALAGAGAGAEAAEAGAGAAELGSDAAGGAAAGAGAGGNVLEMTQTESGAWEYQPESGAAGGEATGGRGGTQGGAKGNAQTDLPWESPEPMDQLQSDLLKNPQENLPREQKMPKEGTDVDEKGEFDSIRDFHKKVQDIREADRPQGSREPQADRTDQNRIEESDEDGDDNYLAQAA